MPKIKIAVIGVGYLGRFHAQKYDQLKDTNLIAVCDINKKTAAKVANELGCDAITDYKDVIDKVDAVSISSTTKTHFEITKYFLQHGKHVLVEKPICTTLAEAQELVALAKQHDCILQVGHLERYNRVILALQEVLDNPRFIESVRAAPFNLRTIDVNVAFDLMIHDIDIIRSLVPSNIKHISANGVSVLSSYIDIANARIEFDNDCVANVTASRVNAKVIRKMRLFQKNGHLALDLSQKRLAHYSVGENEIYPGIPISELSKIISAPACSRCFPPMA